MCCFAVDGHRYTFIRMPFEECVEKLKGACVKLFSNSMVNNLFLCKLLRCD